MPHSLFCSLAADTQNIIKFQKDIYNLRHPSDQHFPVTFSPHQWAVELFYVMSLQKFFLGFCSLNRAIPMLAHGKFTFVWSVTALWEQNSSYLAQVPNPVNHSLILGEIVHTEILGNTQRSWETQHDWAVTITSHFHWFLSLTRKIS